jgi:hypothetical protein
LRVDGRTTARRFEPCNKLSEAERRQILEVANSAKFASLPPSQIVRSLSDRGIYLALESSVRRVLRSASQQHYRGRSSKIVGHEVQDAEAAELAATRARRS